MPKFFFHTNDHIELAEEDGMDLADLDAARRAAIRYAGELLREAVSRISFNDLLQISVTDANHVSLFHIDVVIHKSGAGFLNKNLTDHYLMAQI